MSGFRRFIGIDYSGAATAYTPLQGLRVFVADSNGIPVEVRPATKRPQHWTRRGVAEWVLQQILTEGPCLIGIDHGFSFPASYFERYGLSGDWNRFLDDFSHHWPSDGEGQTVRALREGNLRTGNSRDRRHVEVLAKAKSCFHFDVPGSVASSTHAGLPWLRLIRKMAGDQVHFWPFDGLEVGKGMSVIAEVYPALWYRPESPPDWTRDQWDAYLIAEHLALASIRGRLSAWFRGPWEGDPETESLKEGWILGFKPQ